MSRHPRILFPGAIYHVTSRGNRRAKIYSDERDHLIWLDTLAETVRQFGFLVHAYCLMPNHFHLLVETPDANLSAGMHYLNGRYSKRYNDRHKLAGHLIQGRYHAVLLERERQLLETARYVDLNPVRAQLVATPGQWRWSSYLYLCGVAHPPEWFVSDWILTRFSGDAQDRARRYAEFVLAGIGRPNPLAEKSDTRSDTELQSLLESYRTADRSAHVAMSAAFSTGLFTRSQIARCFNVSIRTVARAIATCTSFHPADELVSSMVPDTVGDTNPAIEATSVGIKARNVV